MASLLPKAILIASASTALVGAGGIAALSLFDVPKLQSQPASRSLPQIRWLFSRGSHVFPTAAILSSTGFLYCAYAALPTGISTLDAVRLTVQGSKVTGFVAASILSFGIAPWTSLMIPTNFRLIEMNEAKGGSRSRASAGQAKKGMSAEESVDGEGQAGQFGDLSGPMEKTADASTKEEDEEVRELLGKFGRLNAVRAVLLGAGGVVGLATALA